MSSSTVFDSLVSTLSDGERRELLERVRASIALDEEPVERELEPQESSVDYAYFRMSIVQKVMLFLRRVVSGFSHEEAVEEFLLRNLARKLRAEAGNLVNVSDDMFLSDFKQEVQQLKEGVHFLRMPVERVRGIGTEAFYSFVLSLEATDTREELFNGTNPFTLADSMGTSDERELRREAEGRLADVLAGIPSWIQGRMRNNAVFFESLVSLSEFDFGEIIAEFQGASSEGDEQCEISRLRGPLQQLGGILKGLSTAPSASLIEGLVLFEGESPRADEDFEAHFRKRVDAVQNKLEVVRGFGRRVPLYDIVRYAAGDVGLRLPEPPGGEGWRLRVERFWSRRIEVLFQLYSFERKTEELLEEAREISEDEPPSALATYPAREGRRFGTHATSIGILSTVLRAVYPTHLFETLKTLFVQGAFYKEENRAEFNEYYGELEDLSNAVADFERRLAEDDGFGAGGAGGGGEDGGEETQRIDRIDETAERLVKRGIEAFHGLSEILGGVLYGEVGGHYDTLSNFEEVGGSDHERFRERLDNVLSRCKAIASQLSRMYDIENTAERRRAELERRSG
ncbi:MAG: DUF5312 family protein [Spirochaetota bacterium]